MPRDPSKDKYVREAARRLGVTKVTIGPNGTPTFHVNTDKLPTSEEVIDETLGAMAGVFDRVLTPKGNGMSKLNDRHERMIEAVLGGARTILEEHIVAIERGFSEVAGEEPARVAITATWKMVKEEGLVLEIAGKATIPATRTTRHVQMLGGQLSLFGGLEGGDAEHAGQGH